MRSPIACGAGRRGRAPRTPSEALPEAPAADTNRRSPTGHRWAGLPRHPSVQEQQVGYHGRAEIQAAPAKA